MKEGLEFMEYLHGPMDAGTKRKVKFTNVRLGTLTFENATGDLGR